MSGEQRAVSTDRSPHYPSIGLPDAIDAVRKLWHREKRTAVPPEVAVHAMGYGSLSGAARSLLAALRQYGLVESHGGSVIVSDVAVDLLVHDASSPDWAAAVEKASTSPGIFRDLTETHSQASDSAIIAYLISKKRFSPDGARKLVRAFRATASLANPSSGGYSKAHASETQTPADDMTTPQTSATNQVMPGQRVSVTQYILDPEMRAEVRFIGAALQPSHIETLLEYLKVASKALGSGS